MGLVVTKKWLNSGGDIHREGGPAMIFSDGSREWLINGKRHRTDGPAVEYNGFSAWWFRGMRHRADGPAIERDDGPSEWWWHGINYPTIDDFIQNAKFESDEQKVLFYLKYK